MSESNEKASCPGSVRSANQHEGSAKAQRSEAPPARAIDHLVCLVRRALDVPIALVTFAEGEQRFHLSQGDLPSPLREEQTSSISAMLSRLIADEPEPLIVPECDHDHRLREIVRIPDSEIVAIAGFPLTSAAGDVVGTLCAIDVKSKQWTTADQQALDDFATMASAIVDLTKRANAANDARSDAVVHQRRIRRLLESTSEGMYGINTEGRCIFANAKCAEILGYDSPDELEGAIMHDKIHHSYADGGSYPVEACVIHAAESFGGDGVSSYELFWNKDGESIPVQYHTFPLIGSDESVNIISFTDISEKLDRQNLVAEALEAAESANLEKSRFLANMSHEIRTPMNAILGFSDLLQNHVQGAKAKRYLEAISSSGESLLSLINNVLDLSKIEAGRLELHPAPLAIRPLLAGMTLMFSQKAEDQNLDFEVSVGDGCPDCLLLDELRIRQVLLNLLGNALKFTKRGRIELSFDVIREPLDDRFLTIVIDVRDTGVGIPEEKLSTIFDPFSQSSAEQAATGTGLGLSICTQIVKLMRGSITVESEMGKGSVFTVRIPRVELAVPSAPDTLGGGRTTDLNLLKESKILVVDDNLFNRELAAGYFEGSHHELAFATDGAGAVDKARRWQPDVVLMDIRMPVMDGRDAHRAIKDDSVLKSIPVLAVTASSLEHQTKQLRKDFDGYLRKPFSRSELFETLSAVLPRFETSIVEDVVHMKEDAELSYDTSEWGSLVESLRELAAEHVPHLSNVMAICEISAFAERMRHLADDHQCPPLSKYGDALGEQASLFELSKIEASLASFGDVIDSIAAMATMPPENA